MKKRVLGIDPGVEYTGWAIVESTNGKIKLIDSWTTHSPGPNASQRKRKKDPLPKLPDNQMQATYERLFEHIEQAPLVCDVRFPIYMESLQYFGGKSQNYNTAITSAFFIGALTEVLSDYTDVTLVDPTMWKRITGNRKADKSAVMRWVEVVTGHKASHDHESDAIAIAIYGLGRVKL